MGVRIFHFPMNPWHSTRTQVWDHLSNDFPADIFVSGSDNQLYRLFSLSQKRFVECSSLDGSLRQSKGKYIENRQVVYAGFRVVRDFCPNKSL